MGKSHEPDPDRPIIAIDGTESVVGRALFTISALYWCTNWLPKVTIRVIDLANEDVSLALSILQFEHGIDCEIHPATSTAEPLEGVDLYVAVAFRSIRHLRLAEANKRGIPVLLAVQFPQVSSLAPSVFLRQRAAYDPRCLATDLYSIVAQWI